MELNDRRSLTFYSFTRLQETYSLLKHLWQIPPSYTTLFKEEDDEEEDYGEDEIGVKYSFAKGKEKDTEKKSYFVNVEGSKKAVGLAEKSRNDTREIAEELDRQGQRLNRIEARVDGIQSNLDVGDRHIRGLKSPVGAIINLVTPNNPKARQNPNIIKREQISYQAWAQNQNVHLDVLLKLPDGSLVDCALFFEKTHFCIKEKATKQPIPKHTWAYNQMKFLVVRARPFHLDVRFCNTNNPTFRLRLMSSKIQAIVNELVLRAAEVRREKEERDIVKVLFEPNGRRFDYGSYFLTLEVIKGRDGQEICVERRGGLGFAGMLSDDVDDDTKKNMTEAEENLEHVYLLAKQTNQNASKIGATLDKQNKQIVRITQKSECAHSRLKDQNRSVEFIHRKL
eukprot:CAMPEP_0201506554 /NCGR_PEP_ID=MMETSP0161_2-20130828/473_1 /ASSEMBLY_ACC=CAM_ASM_000251 /TAXON_ID=180227 /ORGANISM="Neoparamoeba aestuarina, Strain SoJaBio B1-5/56/2" /LENGTH=395 /DNA_ID=CAMNT_0047900681 /DNA_START=489 /DNA_END=1676 /DNA_ORIENTATION=-